MAASLVLNLVLMGTKLRTGYYAAMASFATVLGRGRQHGRPNPSTMEAQAPLALSPLATPAPPATLAPLALTLAPSAPPAPPSRPGTQKNNKRQKIK